MPTLSIAAYHKCPSLEEVDSRPEAVDLFFNGTGRASGCWAKGTGGAAVIWTGSSSSVSGTSSSFDATPHLSRRACLYWATSVLLLRAALRAAHLSTAS